MSFCRGVAFWCLVAVAVAILTPFPAHCQPGYNLEKDVGIKTIFLSNGNRIHCGKTWLGNETIYCHKYRGTVGIPLSQLDLRVIRWHDQTGIGDDKERFHQRLRACASA